LVVGFGIRVCLWFLLIGYAIYACSVGPQIEQFVLVRGIEVPGGAVLAFRVSHLINVHFILFAMWVMIDGVGSLVMALSRAAPSVSRTWSRLMWCLPLILHVAILVGALIGALQVLVKLAQR
jgi:hypothetical protein